MSTRHRKSKLDRAEAKLPATRRTHEKYLNAKASTGISLVRLADMAIDALGQVDSRFAPEAGKHRKPQPA